MKDIAFHITDIAENSIRAHATTIQISLIRTSNQCLQLTIKDNGCGLSEEEITKVSDPFYTTRTTRHVGLGIAFLKQSCEQTGGHLTIVSEPMKGATVQALFKMNHIDAPSIGKIGQSIAQLMSGNPDINFNIKFQSPEQDYEMSTREIKHVLQEISISKPEVSIFLENEFDNALLPITKGCGLFL